MNRVDLNLDTWELSPEQIAAALNGAAPSNLTLQDKEGQKENWCKIDIDKLIALGRDKETNPKTILVLGVICRLHWARRRSERSKPFPLPNEELAKLGVDRNDKQRELALLKKTSLIKVELRGRHLPLVQLIAAYPNNAWKPENI